MPLTTVAASPRLSWRDLLRGTLIVTAGWALAMGLGLLRGSWEAGIPRVLHPGLVLGGLAIGAAQWLVTTRRYSAGAGWALAYGAGWWAGLCAGWFLTGEWLIFAPEPHLVGGVGGASAGLLQWVTLRRHFRLAGLWVPASVAISLAACRAGIWVGVAAYGLLEHADLVDSAMAGAYLVGGATCGLISGSLTALALGLAARSAWSH
jgi:hypothetical protein